jgi:hypothetical protein
MQAARNTALMAQVSSNVYHMYSPSDRTVVTANTDMPEKGKLRLQDANSKNLAQATFVFLDEEGNIMARRPKHTETCALYIPATQQVCVLDVRNKRDYALQRVTSRFWLDPFVPAARQEQAPPDNSRLKAYNSGARGECTALYSLHVFGYVREKKVLIRNWNSITARMSGTEAEAQHNFYFKTAAAAQLELALAGIDKLVQTGPGVALATS